MQAIKDLFKQEAVKAEPVVVQVCSEKVLLEKVQKCVDSFVENQEISLVFGSTDSPGFERLASEGPHYAITCGLQKKDQEELPPITHNFTLFKKSVDLSLLQRFKTIFSRDVTDPVKSFIAIDEKGTTSYSTEGSHPPFLTRAVTDKIHLMVVAKLKSLGSYASAFPIEQGIYLRSVERNLKNTQQALEKTVCSLNELKETF